MDKAPLFVGIDVAKHRLEIHLRPAGEGFTVDHDEGSAAALVERLAALEPALVVLEATGGLEARPAAQLAAAGLPVAVVDPRQVRAFARATGRLAKTDRLVAEAIARFAEAVRPPVRALPDEATRHLGALVARRRQLLG
ncbi:MAG TPA: transposase, partial [Geminicoccaceae bacterium]|nr:transposase [Geminicoccaceae bacterium]